MAETFISGSTDDTMVERPPDGNDVDVRVRAVLDFVPASSPAFRGEMHTVGKSFCSKSRVLTSRLYNGDQTSSLFRWAPQAKSWSRSQRTWSKLLPKVVHWSQCRSGPLCSFLTCCSSSLRDSSPIANALTAYSNGFFCGWREILVSFHSNGG